MGFALFCLRWKVALSDRSLSRSRILRPPKPRLRCLALPFLSPDPSLYAAPAPGFRWDFPHWRVGGVRSGFICGRRRFLLDWRFWTCGTSDEYAFPESQYSHRRRTIPAYPPVVAPSSFSTIPGSQTSTVINLRLLAQIPRFPTIMAIAARFWFPSPLSLGKRSP